MLHYQGKKHDNHFITEKHFAIGYTIHYSLKTNFLILLIIQNFQNYKYCYIVFIASNSNFLILFVKTESSDNSETNSHLVLEHYAQVTTLQLKADLCIETIVKLQCQYTVWVSNLGLHSMSHVFIPLLCQFFTLMFITAKGQPLISWGLWATSAALKFLLESTELTGLRPSGRVIGKYRWTFIC